MLGQPSSDCPCLFGSQVQGKIFFIGIKNSELGSLVGTDDCKNTGDRFSQVVTKD